MLLRPSAFRYSLCHLPKLVPASKCAERLQAWLSCFQAAAAMHLTCGISGCLPPPNALVSAVQLSATMWGL